MATISTNPEQRFVLRDVSWEAYEALLVGVADRHILMAYDEGTLEMMSPSAEHELYKHRLNRIILIVTEEFDLPIVGLGSTTWRKRAGQKGLEPDECYYFRKIPLASGRDEIDLSADPPPDLAVEIELSTSAVNRLGIYAMLGVPEVWRFDGDVLLACHLGVDSTYRECPTSLNLPMLPLAEAAELLKLHIGSDETAWAREVRKWVRSLTTS